MVSAELIEMCRGGNRNAQRLLYELYSRKIFGVCRRYIRNYDDAKDVCQESFIKIFRNLDKLKSPEKLESWMKKVAVNTAITFFNDRRARNQTLISEAHENIIDQINKIQEKEDEDSVLHMINSLAEGQRVVFNLYEIEGYSHKEIASMLKIAVGTSKAQLARARDVLKKKMMISEESTTVKKYA